MAQPVLMQIDQTGLPAGTPGRSRTDGLASGAQVTLTDVSASSTTLFELLWVPLGDTTAVASLNVTGNPKVWIFTPSAGVYGEFRIRCTKDAGLGTEEVEVRTLGIRLPNTGILIPSLNSVANADASLVNAGASIISDSENNAIDFGDPDLDAVPYAGWWRSHHLLFTSHDSHVGDTNNPHATSVGNLGSGSLLELNTIITDATLDDVGDPRTPLPHASTHISSGTDEIDGDRLDIDFTPSNYTPDTTPPEVTIIAHLTAHLAGIDNALSGLGSGVSFGTQGQIPYTNATTDDFDYGDAEIVATYVRVGQSVSSSIQSGSVVLGNGAGAALAAGSSGTTALGAGAGASIAGGASNTVVGNNAGGSINSGNSNVVAGSGAGGSLTSGSGNVVLGATAATLATGNNNVLIGSGADTPAASSTGHINILGGLILDPDNSIVMIGVGAAKGNGSNVVIGDGAGAAQAGSASSNTLVGFEAAPLLTAPGNTVLGASAAAALVGGSGNVLLGNSVAASLTGSGNLIAGSSAGSSVTSGSGNTLLNVGSTTLTTGSNNVLIGAGADTPAAGTSNYTSLNGVVTNDNDETTVGRASDDFTNAQNENGKSDLVPSIANEQGDLTGAGTAVPLTQTVAGAATAMAVSSEYHFKVKVSIHDGTNFLEPAEYRVYSRRGASGAPSTPIATLVHEGDLGTDSVAFSVDGTNNTIQATPTVASGEKRFKITAEAKREALMSPET